VPSKHRQIAEGEGHSSEPRGPWCDETCWPKSQRLKEGASLPWNPVHAADHLGEAPTSRAAHGDRVPAVLGHDAAWE